MMKLIAIPFLLLVLLQPALHAADPAAVNPAFHLGPIPPALQAVRGVHPRIYLNAARIVQLRAAVATTHRALWLEVKAQADQAARQGPPKYVEHDNYSGDEQLWQREVGNAMPTLAMAYVVTGQPQYLDSARAWALASCAYPTWGLGRNDGLDLAAGHQLFGLGIVYDWCYDGLGDAARRTIRDTLVKRGGAMYTAAATGAAWWHKSYLQNHLWVNICGLSVAGFALFDEVDEASGWIALPLAKFRHTMDALGPDGASHEGVGYWQYGVEYLLKFMVLARDLLGVNLYHTPWFRNTAAYPQYLSLPRHAWTKSDNIVDIADCPRGNWYGPDYLLRALAHEYHDGYAQWLAQEVDGANIDSPEARWLNLIWFDPAIATQPPTDPASLRGYGHCLGTLRLVWRRVAPRLQVRAVYRPQRRARFQLRSRGWPCASRCQPFCIIRRGRMADARRRLSRQVDRAAQHIAD